MRICAVSKLLLSLSVLSRVKTFFFFDGIILFGFVQFRICPCPCQPCRASAPATSTCQRRIHVYMRRRIHECPSRFTRTIYSRNMEYFSSECLVECQHLQHLQLRLVMMTISARVDLLYTVTIWSTFQNFSSSRVHTCNLYLKVSGNFLV